MSKKTVIIAYGTRPELIKLFPLIKDAKLRPNLRVVVCSTGQHREMLETLHEMFEIYPDVDFKLMKPNQNLTTLHAEAMLCMRELILKEKPNWLVVQGDTATAHASAMAAFYERIPVAHVEAGLRTYSINSPFPEEMNRRVIGLVARAHFASTLDASLNLKDEGIDSTASMLVTGNTGIDTLLIIENKIQNSPDLMETLSSRYKFLNLDKFVLATMHRRENFGEPFSQILRSLRDITKRHNIDLLLPVHPNPNVRLAVEQTYSSEIGKSVFWVNQNSKEIPNSTGRIFLIEPLNYLDMVFLLKRCKFIMTDSGGLQEEAPTFAKKILVLRESTERPEGVEAGFSEIVGSDFNLITGAADRLMARDHYWSSPVPPNPFGDGKAAEKILDYLEKF